MSQASNLYWDAVGQKNAYENYLAQHPNATESTDSNLSGWHDQALSDEAQLRAIGFGDAADVLVADSASNATAWGNAHVDYLNGGGSNPSTSGSPTTPIAPVSIPLAATQGIGADVAAVGAGVSNFFAGIGAFFANPGGWFQNLGSGIESGTKSAAIGVGTGAQFAGQGIGAGAASIAKAVIVPTAIILGLLWLNKGVRIRENRTTHTSGKGLLGWAA